MYKQVFNPNQIEKLSTEDIIIIHNCLRMQNGLKNIKNKYPKLWYKLDLRDLYDIETEYRKQQTRIDSEIKKIVPAYTPEIMEMSQKLNKILLEKIPVAEIDFIFKLVKNYIKICLEINKENSGMLKLFTPEMYIESIRDGTLVK